MPTILAFDTTVGVCAAALWRDGRTLHRESAEMARGHAEALMPMIERVMQAGDTGYSQLDAIAVTTGPGAFTGIRIGLATARGLALATGKTAIGVGTLEAIAASAAGGRLLVVVDTKRHDFYAQRFDGASPRGEPRVVAYAELVAFAGQGPLLLAGDGAGMARRLLEKAGTEVQDSGIRAPDPAALAALAAKRLSARADHELPQPLYLRAPEARLPANRGARRP